VSDYTNKFILTVRWSSTFWHNKINR